MYSRTENLCQSQEMRGGGTSTEVEAKLAELESLIEQTKALRADLETYGMVKLSDSSAVTDSTGLALPATEKNASIEGTLANGIEMIKGNSIPSDLKGMMEFYVPSFQSYIHSNANILVVAFELKNGFAPTGDCFDDDIMFKVSGSLGYERKYLYEETIRANSFYDTLNIIGYKSSNIKTANLTINTPKILLFGQENKKYIMLMQKFTNSEYNFAQVYVYPYTISSWRDPNAFYLPYNNAYAMPLKILTPNMFYSQGDTVAQTGWTINWENPIAGIPNGEQIWLKEGTFLQTEFLA